MQHILMKIMNPMLEGLIMMTSIRIPDRKWKGSRQRAILLRFEWQIGKKNARQLWWVGFVSTCSKYEFNMA